MDRRKAEGLHEIVGTGLKSLRRHLGLKPQAFNSRAFSTPEIDGHPDLGSETPGFRLARFQHAKFIGGEDLQKMDAGLEREPSIDRCSSSQS